MPTVLRERGYRFVVFVDEPDEPAHVHAIKANSEAKFWLSPVALEWSRGFRQHDLREIADILEKHANSLIHEYEKIHSKK